jgi:hypothetical protein
MLFCEATVQMIRLLLFVLCFCSLQSAHSAEIKFVVDAKLRGVGCNLRLEGPIVPGDKDRLITAHRRLSNANPILCLDSPGGDYEEGLRIAEFILDKDDKGTDMVTSIESGAQCYSACAFIFLAGKFTGKGYFAPGRTLHAGGTLGFHAPFVDLSKLPNQPYSSGDIAAAYRLAMNGIAKAMGIFGARQYLYYDEIGKKTEPWVSPSLFAEILSRGPSELFLIDTIGKAGHWNIHLADLRDHSIVATEDLGIACDNIAAWNDDKSYPTGKFNATEPDPQVLAKLLPEGSFYYYFFKRPSGTGQIEEEMHCVVRTQGRVPVRHDIFFKISLSKSAPNGSWLNETFYGWAMYPATQLIRELKN